MTTEKATRLPDKILDFCDLISAEHMDAGMAYWQHLEKRYAGRGLGQMTPVYDDLKAGYVTESLAAFIDAGRWIVQCPTCRSATVACCHDPFFMCTSCGNAGFDGRWVRVGFPDDKEELEAFLETIPGFRGSAPDRNWRPGELIK